MTRACQTFVVVVECDKRSTTVGPYRSSERAHKDADAWDGTEGRSCFVEPLANPERYLREAALHQEDAR